MATYSFPDVDTNALEARLAFLVWMADMADAKPRSSSEERNLDSLVVAERALNRRDRGVISLLLGKVDEGKDLLYNAGLDLAEMGLPYGLVLAGLSGRLSKEDSDERLVQFLSAPAGVDALRPEVSSPAQVVALIQAAGMSSNTGIVRKSGAFVSLLEQCAHIEMPDLPITVGHYWSEMLNLARREHFVEPSRVIPWLFFSREETLAVARSDRYHWNRIQKPMDIVGLGLLALCVQGIREGHRQVIATSLGESNALVRLPLTLAERLTDPEDPRPSSRRGLSPN